MNRLCLAVLISVLVAACGDESSPSHSNADTTSDVAADDSSGSADSSEEACDAMKLEYGALLLEARTCNDASECIHVISESLGCGCSTWAADANATEQLKELAATFAQDNCQKPCANTCPTTSAATCADGKCK